MTSERVLAVLSSRVAGLEEVARTARKVTPCGLSEECDNPHCVTARELQAALKRLDES